MIDDASREQLGNPGHGMRALECSPKEINGDSNLKRLREIQEILPIERVLMELLDVL